jgi:hypothetical protein
MKVLLGIDCETDVGSWGTTYEGLVNATPILLRLMDRHHISTTFFFTGDSARRHPEVVRMVRDAGHEVGCHSLYHETVGTPIFEIPGVYPLLAEEVENRLRVATDVVGEVAGRQPVSFRCPRLFGSTEVVNALEALGYKADATYPMYFYRERLTPYHPSAGDWTQPGALQIVELPNFADLSMTSTDQWGRDMDQWPLFRTEGTPALMRHVDGYINYCRQRDAEPFLCFYFHPWEFHPMPEGDIRSGEGTVRPDPFIVKNCGPYAVQQFDLLLNMLSERGAQFFQAGQIAEDTL